MLILLKAKVRLGLPISSKTKQISQLDHDIKYRADLHITGEVNDAL